MIAIAIIVLLAAAVVYNVWARIRLAEDYVELEARYTDTASQLAKLTDRDERGRFVKR